MMKKHIFLSGILCIFLCSGSPENKDPNTGLTAVEARKASEFINSIGVNTHFGYEWANYKYWDERLRPRLLELGIKHIRDGTYSTQVAQKYRDIGNYGIKLLLITKASTAVDKAKALAPMLWGIEAVNEPDNWNPDRSKPWEEAARLEQQQLYENIKADSATRNIPVVGLSLANIRDNPAITGDLSRWMDYGNIHPYAAGQHPLNHWGWGLSMNDAISRAKKVSADKPLIATESGYHNKVNNPNHPGVSEEAAAIYHLHLPFVYFNAGIYRTYKYEFLDLNPDSDFTDMECHFGLIRNDGSPKPSFTALKNLLGILSDTEKEFTTSPLSFEIVPPQNETIYYTLLQKTDGSWWLALYRNVTVYSLSDFRNMDVAPVNVKINLGIKVDEANVYIPNIGTQPQQIIKNKKQISLDLGPELTLIRIKNHSM